MANAQGVDVRQCPGQLVEVQLHQQHGQGLLALVVLPGYAVNRLGDELQDQVEVQLVRLYGGEEMAGSAHGVYETSNRNGRFKLPLFRVLLSPVIKKRGADPEDLPGVDAFSAKKHNKTNHPWPHSCCRKTRERCFATVNEVRIYPHSPQLQHKV